MNVIAKVQVYGIKVVIFSTECKLLI